MGAWFRRLLLDPVLILGSCHLLMTGSPVPLWHIEELQFPVSVRSVAERHLVLADGQTVTLPVIETPGADILLLKQPDQF